MKMEPSTMHMMIPQAPSTSPMDSDAEADLVSLVEVAQLTKFENRSGEELHQESRIAIKAPYEKHGMPVSLLTNRSIEDCWGQKYEPRWGKEMSDAHMPSNTERYNDVEQARHNKRY